MFVAMAAAAILVSLPATRGGGAYNSAQGPPPAPRAPSTVHLLADPATVVNAANAQITFGPVVKAAENPLLREDRPWEPALLNTYVVANLATSSVVSV